MVDVLPLDELEKRVGSLYEAVAIVAQRARQINELQRRMIERQNENRPDDDDELDDTILDRDIVDRQYIKLPKPTTIAMQEMLNGELKYEYLDDND